MSMTPDESLNAWRLDLRLPFRLPTPNQVMRMHWASRAKMTRGIATEVWLAMQRAKIARPPEPLPFAAVEVVRYSTTEPDPDSLRGCAKLLLDTLQPPSKRHPYGLGILRNDDAASIHLTVRHERAKRGLLLTTLRVEGAPREA